MATHDKILTPGGRLGRGGSIPLGPQPGGEEETEQPKTPLRVRVPQAQPLFEPMVATVAAQPFPGTAGPVSSVRAKPGPISALRPDILPVVRPDILRIRPDLAPIVLVHNQATFLGLG